MSYFILKPINNLQTLGDFKRRPFLVSKTLIGEQKNLKKINFFRKREYLYIKEYIMETIAWLSWSLVLVAMLWMMSNEKIKVIFGEFRKILQILPISKIAQAIINYYKNKGGK